MTRKSAQVSPEYIVEIDRVLAGYRNETFACEVRQTGGVLSDPNLWYYWIMLNYAGASLWGAAHGSLFWFSYWAFALGITATVVFLKP